MKKASSEQRAVQAIVSGVLLALILLFLTAAFAYDGENDDSPKFNVDLFNIASEKESLSQLNIYFKISYEELQFIKANKDSFRADYKLTVDVLDASNLPADFQEIERTVYVDDIEKTSSAKDFSLFKMEFDLQPGDYELTLMFEDSETKKVARDTHKVNLKSFTDDRMMVSDILYLDRYERNQNGRIVFYPRVSETKEDRAKIYSYFEVYNVPKGDSFEVKYSIEGKGKTLIEDSYWTASDGRITQNFIDIVGEVLPHGRYNAEIDVLSAKDSLRIEKPFKWLIEGLPETFDSVGEAIVALKYIANGDEYDRLMNTPKQLQHIEFQKFWKSRDPTPQTSDNEIRDAYYARIAYANDHYKGVGKPGWKTDMGWAYVMLGPPDEISSVPITSSGLGRRGGKTLKGIEAWTYHAYSRQLVFIDEDGFGEYHLDNPDVLYELID